MWLGPFDLNGSEFLLLYVVLLGFAWLASVMLAQRNRPAGRDQAVDDPDYIAYLAGGADRVCESAVARLVAGGGLIHQADGRFTLISRDAATSDIEHKILMTRMPTHWPKFLPRLEKPMRQVELKMISAGLLMTEAQRSHMRRLQALPFIVVFAVGLVKVLVGVSRDRPVGFLLALLLLTAVCGFLRYRRVDARTVAGVRALDGARTRSSRLRAAPMAPEIGMAVALFGMPVLMGSPFESLHARRDGSRSDGSDGGSWSGGSDSGGDSGGGGCGGGCGGCGS
jgi:uncharacterized protein (TIGR04222 family)